MSLLLVLALLAPGDDLAETLRKLRETAGRSVVAIDVSRSEDPEGRTGSGEVAQHRDYYNRPVGPCTGVVWEADGFILTTRFNVSGTIRKHGLKVTLWDGRQEEAELLGTDEQRDLALLKIPLADLPVLPRADLKNLGQGTFVALLGRSPERDRVTVNHGILSAMDRMKRAAVQTDAEMNYGNAGGPLLTLAGELVGMACNIRPDAVWGQSGGVGFACKVAEIDALLPRLKKGERIAAEKVPHLGVHPGEGDAEIEGYQVAEVLPDSPAQKAGILKDDVIVELGGRKIVDGESLKEALEERKIGDEVAVRIRRRTKEGIVDKEFKVKLEGRAER